jgi:NADH-quinone oxidoreductase subunit F
VLEGVAARGTGRVRSGGLREARRNRHLLLPALHALQDSIGWISPGGLGYVSERLSIPPAEAYGVATFYAMLSVEERPGPVAHVCDDMTCSGAAAELLIAALDGRDDVHRSPCLGLCERAPAVFLQMPGAGNTVLGPATAEGVATALDGEPSPRLPPIPAAAPHTGTGSPRILLSRVGTVDPTSLDAYRGAGGFAGLTAAIAMGPSAVIAEIEASRLRGRGGAAFPAGVKWKAVAEAADDVRYVVCNADESEPGTFKDRVLLEDDPFAVVEGLTIAGYATGAARGYLYVRGEYPLAAERMTEAIRQTRDAGLLGTAFGSSFDIEVRRGAGAYICGEETALFNSIEGMRGEPRQKPPFPTQSGLFAKPTLVNNVETLVNVPLIVGGGGAVFAAVGTEESTGNKLFSISGAVAVPGVYEVEFGATIGDVIDLAGGCSGAIGAVLVGGAAGAFVSADDVGIPLTFEGTRAAGIPLGSGSIIVFDDRTDFGPVVRRIARFFAEESCGQCVPCRVGTVRQQEAIDRMLAGGHEAPTLSDLDRVLRDASICGLGQFASNAVQSALVLGLVGGGR